MQQLHSPPYSHRHGLDDVEAEDVDFERLMVPRVSRLRPLGKAGVVGPTGRSVKVMRCH